MTETTMTTTLPPTYTITFIGAKKFAINAVAHFFDPNIEGVMVVEDVNGDFHYFPLVAYYTIKIDGAGLRLAQATSKDKKDETEPPKL
jgi:hypothetical protein